MKIVSKASLAIAIHNEQERHLRIMREFEQQMIKLSTNMKKPILALLSLKFFFKTLIYFIPFIIASDLIYFYYTNSWYSPYGIGGNELLALYCICVISLFGTILYTIRCFKEGRVL